MLQDPRGDRTDDLDPSTDPVVMVSRPQLRERQAAADQSHAAYLCSHGLRWTAELPDDPHHTDWPAVAH